MNALKAFLLMVAIIFSPAVSAVMVSIVPGKENGIYTGPYFGGLIAVNASGKEMLAMPNQIGSRFGYEVTAPRWYTNPASWETNLNSQGEILNGAVVNYSSEHYRKTALSWIYTDEMFVGIDNAMLPDFDPNFNYRGSMIKHGSHDSDDDDKKIPVCPPSIPIPPAFWLFGSGLLGLVGAARKKSSKSSV